MSKTIQSYYNYTPCRFLFDGDVKQCLIRFIRMYGGGSGSTLSITNTSTIELFGTGTVADPLGANYIGPTGISSVATANSATVTLSGTGIVGDPLTADFVGAVPTIYTADGSLTSVRQVDLNSNTLIFTGGGGTNINLTAASQQIKIGATGFNINNAGIVNTNFSLTGGGTFTVTDQGSIQLQKVTSGGSTSTVLMNPSSIQGLFLQDIKGSITSQMRLDASSTGQTIIRTFSGTIESNIDILPGSIDFNRVVSVTTTTILKVDTTNQKVILPLITSSPFLTTDGSGNITTGTKAAHVDPSTGTVSDVVNALIAAGLMA